MASIALYSIFQFSFMFSNLSLYSFNGKLLFLLFQQGTNREQKHYDANTWPYNPDYVVTGIFYSISLAQVLSNQELIIKSPDHRAFEVGK